MFRKKEHLSLKELNTFGIEVSGDTLVEFYSEHDIVEYIRSYNPVRENNLLILGGGSNLLFTKDFEGLILHPLITGIEVVSEDQDFAIVRSGCGVVWDDFVEYCVSNNFYGAENLSLIPGNVGAAPIQNIGAYGIEAKDIIDKVEALSIETAEKKLFLNKDCEFGYRDSIFKHALKDSYIVTYVHFKLRKQPHFTLGYGNLQTEAEREGKLTLRGIRDAVIRIRTSKLPDPNELGNAGSFFKNPVVSLEFCKKLQNEYPQMPVYPVSDTHCKIAAGWLIDQCGMKGFRHKNAGVHEKQALVLVNHGNAKGNDIAELAEIIQFTIKEKFGISLSPEVIFL